MAVRQADSLLVSVLPEQMHQDLVILKQLGPLDPGGSEVPAVTNVLKLITNSRSAAELT